MDILPGQGLPVARVGQTQAEIEASVGSPSVAEAGRAFWNDHAPAFSVHFDAEGGAELVEVFHGELGEEQATLGDVQLTYRLMDDVAADLDRAGYTGRRVDIGWEYDAGFVLWSSGSRNPSDLEPGAPFDPEDQRLVVEGIGIAPIAYWHEA